MMLTLQDDVMNLMKEKNFLLKYTKSLQAR